MNKNSGILDENISANMIKTKPIEFHVGDLVQIILRPNWYGTISWIAPNPEDLYHVVSDGETYRLSKSSLLKVEVL